MLLLQKTSLTKLINLTNEFEERKGKKKGIRKKAAAIELNAAPHDAHCWVIQYEQQQIIKFLCTRYDIPSFFSPLSPLMDDRQ